MKCRGCKLSNGALLKAADAQFDALITTDRNLRHQQNLAAYRLAIVVKLAEDTRSRGPNSCRNQHTAARFYR